LVIGEFPNRESDAYGIQFVGNSGEFLQKALRKQGISLNRDCWKINAVNCRTPDGRIPTHKEIKCCYPFVEKAIRELKPKFILLFGSIAVTSLFGDDFSNRSINRWRAYQIPDEKFKCFIIPLFDPSRVARNERDKNLQSLFERDLRRVARSLKREYTPPENYEEYVTVLTDFKKVKRLLERIIKRKTKIAFDYETTGLKPYRAGHKIATIGIAVSRRKAFAFPFDYKSFWTREELKELKRLWKKILKDKEIRKIAHNHKFEDMWSKVRGGSRPKGWLWDPMMAEHILDNRSASTGLKFQTFVNYGIRPYDKIINPYLRSKNGEFNTIEQAPFKELLIYNGLDCIYTWMRYEDQRDKLPRMKNMFRAYGFFMKGLRTMGTIQNGGINVDQPYYKKLNVKLKKDILKLEKQLTTGREAKKFKKQFGRPINITSNQDLGKLFFEVLGKPPVYTSKDNYKTDKATLEGLNLPFVDKLLEKKRLEKAKGTYLAQFAREAYKGVMHPFFDLHIPVSYRGSSSMPNFQNLPKRDPYIGGLIRKGIVPSPNCVICEADFSGAEVITSVCYHHDKNFYNYLVDPHTDMHRDNATDIWMLPHDMLENTANYNDEQKKAAKMIRFFAKNNWTFAQFYGDWWGSCGPTLWENVVKGGLKLPNGMLVQDWLETQGIYELGEIEEDGPTPGSFLEHCAHVEDKMWNERFPEYTQWKKDIVEFYQRYGYIETFFGFRFQGYMDRKQCTNFPIQGTSFHLLVYTLIQVDAFIRKHKLQTKLIGQIHDSIIADVHKDELQFYLKGVNDIVSGLQQQFKWLIVPMEIEAEISRLREDGGTFAEMKEVDPLNPIIW
jgi:uracil-DNA glycosylase family 4